MPIPHLYTTNIQTLRTMKKAFLIFASIGIIGTFTISCNKNNLDQPGFPGLRFAAGNKEYVADTAFYQRSLGTTVYGQSGGSTIVRIVMPRTDTIGTVSLDTTYNTAYFLDGVTTWQSISGTMNITKYYNDSLHTMTGSFSFTGRDMSDHSKTMNIEYGYFNDIPRH